MKASILSDIPPLHHNNSLGYRAKNSSIHEELSLSAPDLPK
jgi:hypothetical protein